MNERVTGHRGRQTFFAWAGAAVVIVTAVASVAAAAVIAARQHERAALTGQRPSGIPAAISSETVNLMGLSPVPASRAPGFALTDQDDRRLPLSGFRGKVVVLEFMDSRCTDICPLISREFIDAYHDLGTAAGGVVFAAVNVNGQANQVGDVLAYTRAHQLTAIPDWYFFTGPQARCRQSGAPTTSRWRRTGRRARSHTPLPSSSSARTAPSATSPTR